MTDLTPDDEALLERARAGDAPTADDHARVKRKLLLQLGVGIGVSTATGSATGAGVGTGVAAGSTAVAGSGFVVKVVAAVAVMAALGGGAAGVNHWRKAAMTVPVAVTPTATAMATSTPTSTPTTTTTTTTTAVLSPVNPPPVTSPPPVTVVAPPATARARDVAPSPIVHEWTEVPVSPATTASPPPDPVTADVPAPTTTTAVPAGPTTLDAEADLLRRADAARKSGDAAGALALLELHRARYPNGILVEEREAERIVVLCALGRTDEAHAAAARFLRDHPRSPQAARVRASCGGG